MIKHGEWGSDRHIRLFNRKTVQWNTAAVHEQLQLPPQAKVITLPGNVLHYTVHSLQDYMEKTVRYARLNAVKYFEQGKKSSFVKLRMSPSFSFVQNYLLRLGFLDGWEGYLTAKTTALYTFLKYAYLKGGGKWYYYPILHPQQDCAQLLRKVSFFAAETAQAGAVLFRGCHFLMLQFPAAHCY